MNRLIIADDHQMFIDGLKSILQNYPQYQVVGQANNGTQVMDLLEKTETDIVLLDINMPEMNGINTTALIRKKFPKVKVLILTMYKTKGFINGLVRTGASGYILKNTGNAELLQALNTVAAGGTFFSSEVAQTLTDKPNRYSLQEEVTLSKREIEIVRELANGLTTKDISEKLHLSYYTVETHRKNINAKLGLTNAAEVIRYAIESGLID